MKQVVEVARSYVGTPWIHGACLKGVGIDCAQLLFAVFRECGIDVEVPPRYTLFDQFHVLHSQVKRYCKRIERIRNVEDIDEKNFVLEDYTTKWREGDILLYRAKLMHNHAGIYSGEGTMIHAYSSPGFMRVVEQPIDYSWYIRLHSVYRLK